VNIHIFIARDFIARDFVANDIVTSNLVARYAFDPAPWTGRDDGLISADAHGTGVGDAVDIPRHSHPTISSWAN
jgi:hypothetical protein